jgi:quinoprotein glucose dehydrogenase
MMPGFSQLSKEDRENILSYILNEVPKEVASSSTKGYVSPYQMMGYNKFLDSKGLPALSPPWGTLNAIDLNTGKYLWKIPFGDEPALAQKGITGTGAENYGGPIVTASGLLIIGAAKDGKLRIYASKTGKLLRTITLPAAAFATPSTYSVDGKQYIVIACGGTKLGTPKGNKYVAFSL